MRTAIDDPYRIVIFFYLPCNVETHKPGVRCAANADDMRFMLLQKLLDTAITDLKIDKCRGNVF